MKFLYGILTLLFGAVCMLCADEVVVTGVGPTPQAALREAFREAVRQGIGTYIESSTLVRNDEIINDTILEVAYGYVDRYTKISEKETGGKYHVAIKAEVSNQAVSAVLANILPARTLSEKDRKNLNTQIGNEISNQVNHYLRKKRKEENDAKIKIICKRIFYEYYLASMLIYEFTPKSLKVLSADDRTTEIQVSGIITPRRDLYELILNSLVGKFEKMLQKKLQPGPKQEIDGSVFGVFYDSDKLIYGYSLDGLDFLADTRDLKAEDPRLLVYFINKRGDLIYPLTTINIKNNLYPPNKIKIKNQPWRYIFHRQTVIAPRFKIDSRDSGSINGRWIQKNYIYGFTINCKVPITIARDIAGVKGFLSGNEAGEALLEQLLRAKLK